MSGNHIKTNTQRLNVMVSIHFRRFDVIFTICLYIYAVIKMAKNNNLSNPRKELIDSTVKKLHSLPI